MTVFCVFYDCGDEDSTADAIHIASTLDLAIKFAETRVEEINVTSSWALERQTDTVWWNSCCFQVVWIIPIEVDREYSMPLRESELKGNEV